MPAGGDEGYQAYAERLEGLTSQYKHVVLIGAPSVSWLG